MEQGNYSREALEAREGLRQEAREHLVSDQGDDNFDEYGWPVVKKVCTLDVVNEYAHLIKCNRHGYRHVRRVINHINRV